MFERLCYLDNKKIDISGPDGNAFVILGKVMSLLRQLEVAPAEIDRFHEAATSDDYDHLCETVTAATGIKLVMGRPDAEEYL